MAAFTAEPAGMSTGIVAPGRELRADEETDCELPVAVGTTGGIPPAPETVGAAARVWDMSTGVVAPGRELRADEETDCELPVAVGTAGV